MKTKINIVALVICSLFMAISYPDGAKGELPKSIVRADASNSLGTFSNMAGGVNFWGPIELRQMFVDDVGTDLGRIKIRLHEVQKEGESYTNLPFSEEDFKQELELPPGGNPRFMIQIYGVPYWLSTSKDTRIFTNNIPNYAKYPPIDYEEWSRLVSATVTRLKECGLASGAYYEIFGEPNMSSTWYQQIMVNPNGPDEPNEVGHNTAEVIQNFYKIYEYTALGIRAADPDAKIGGVAIVAGLSGFWWTRLLCQEIKARNLPLDFYSWHTYRTDEKLSELLALTPVTWEKVREVFEPRFRWYGFNPDQIEALVDDVYRYINALQQQGQEAVRRPYSFHSTLLKDVLGEEGFGEVELFLTEWNVNCGRDIRHETHYGASFVTRGLIDLTDSYTEAQTFYCLREPVNMGGDMSLFAGNIPKASFNAFKSFAMLGSDNERISVGSSDSDIYSIATRDHESISLLATYYVMDEQPEYFSPSAVKEVTVEIQHIPFEGYNYEIYLISGNHSNAFFGSGPELELVRQGTGSGDFEESGNLGIYGVVLIKINKIES
jgi:hypothetical protein